MERIILVETYPWETRVAVLENGRLSEIFWADPHEQVGKIYKGRIKDVKPGLNCVFVDIGLSKNAYLQFADIPRLSGNEDKAASILKSGQNIMVQVKKEAFSEKGARVTANISIPGYYCILLPFQQGISVSRKIQNDARRSSLKSHLATAHDPVMGLISRTASVYASKSELLDELEQLRGIWNSIKNRYLQAKAPHLIYDEMDLIKRTLRDYSNTNVSRVLVNSRSVHDQLSCYLASSSRNYRMELNLEEGPLFDRYGLERDIARLFKRRVWLKSGGYLVFDHTEAMTLVDVNSGKYASRENIETTALVTNREAAAEIARQLRLRSIGGIIVIDFIDMQNRDHNQEVLDILAAELEKDTANTKVIGMTGLGFVEMTRKKARYGLTERFKEECAHCRGEGEVLKADYHSSRLKKLLLGLELTAGENIRVECGEELYRDLTGQPGDIEYIKHKKGCDIAITAVDNLSKCEYHFFKVESLDENTLKELPPSAPAGV